ncbi:hypothetical protein JHK87_033494 [Glycine soja]|nr:hypothetical protein JHK87_033494 [Glycine soja]
MKFDRLDKIKHYRYNRNHGHNTEDCWALKDKIEELIQAEVQFETLSKESYLPDGLEEPFLMLLDGLFLKHDELILKLLVRLLLPRHLKLGLFQLSLEVRRHELRIP